MRLRIALIICALVALPAVAFAVARDHRAPTKVYGWTAYTTSGTSPIAVTTGGTGSALTAELVPTTVKAVLNTTVAHYLDRHPGSSCSKSQGAAICATSDPNTVVILVPAADTRAASP